MKSSQFHFGQTVKHTRLGCVVFDYSSSFLDFLGLCWVYQFDELNEHFDQPEYHLVKKSNLTVWKTEGVYKS